jgi:hypothetical protein
LVLSRRSLAKARKNPSAIWLLVELPVERNSTLGFPGIAPPFVPMFGKVLSVIRCIFTDAGWGVGGQEIRSPGARDVPRQLSPNRFPAPVSSTRSPQSDSRHIRSLHAGRNYVVSRFTIYVEDGTAAVNNSRAASYRVASWKWNCDCGTVEVHCDEQHFLRACAYLRVPPMRPTCRENCDERPEQRRGGGCGLLPYSVCLPMVASISWNGSGQTFSCLLAGKCTAHRARADREKYTAGKVSITRHIRISVPVAVAWAHQVLITLFIVIWTVLGTG